MSSAFDPTGKLGVSGGSDGTVRLWDLSTGEEQKRFVGHSAGVLCVAVSPDGNWAASGGKDRTVRIWDLKSGEQLRCITDHGGHAWHVSAHGPDQLVTAGDARFCIWNVHTGDLIQASPEVPGGISSAAFIFSDVNPQALLGSDRQGLRAMEIGRSR